MKDHIVAKLILEKLADGVEAVVEEEVQKRCSCVRQHNLNLQERLRLQGSSLLPKTADGVTVYPEDHVWQDNGKEGIEEYRVVEVRSPNKKNNLHVIIIGRNAWHCSNASGCFSTKELAEAHKNKKE